ncbi:hypothetical protein [Clostridium sp. ZBS4]|uniref:hypothetical protein n=1 Tax=Clostridium sp. ZBS4 TaxID=2949974 RepID=UPI0020796547|nr:hypothetical protein [Clostridium sp. ZBS4]
MEDNLSKFEVAGGKEYLIDEVKRAFLFRNEEGQEKDYNKFIISIAQLYEEDEVKIFFSKIYEWISDEYKFAYLDELNGSKEFWKCFICSDDLIVQKGIIQFIKSDIYVFINFYRLYHDIFYKIVSDNEFKKITLANWLTENWTVFENTNIYWDILCEILNYIPEDDIKDFNKKIVGKRNLWSLPPDDKESFLKDKGYFEACKEYLFEYNEVLGRERDGFDFIQSSNNVDFWIECLKNIDINNNVVRKSMDVIKMIIRKYDNGSYFFCNSAYRKLEKFFKAEKTIFNEFIDNCNEMEISAKEFKENFI